MAAVALAGGLFATTLVYAQSTNKAKLPSGVVSEDADDVAIRGKRPVGNLSVGMTTAGSISSPQRSPATSTLPATTTPTTAISSPVTVVGNVATSPAGTATTSVPITADSVRAADFGLWLTGDSRGLMIADLATTGPLSGLGLLPGDRIVSINGQRTATEREFLTQLLADNVRTQQVNLTVARNGENRVIQLTPSNLIQGIVQADPLFQAGVVVDPNSPGKVIIQRVFPRTPAYYAGLRVGDVITNVGGQPIVTSTDLQRTWSGTSGFPIQVTRSGQPRMLTLDGIRAASATSASATPTSSGGLFTNQGRTQIGGTTSAQVTGPAAATGPAAIVAPQGTVATPTAIAPPNATTSGGLFPNTAIPAPPSAIAPPAAAIPGTTQRVPVTIPGASSPPAGNPVVPAAPATAPRASGQTP